MTKIINRFFWAFALLLFFFSRLINLKIIPIFTDEAIYSYWAQVALNDPENRYISLVDGKQPLFIWISAVLQKFISDPLIATRMTSVVSGLFAVIGIYLLSKELFNKRVAQVSALLYIVLPFTLLYDRLGLYDSLLTMLGIYSAYFSVKMAKDPRLDFALLNGISIGLSLITKSSGYFFLFLIPSALIIFDFKNKKTKTRFFKWIYLSAISVFIAQVIYNSLRLSPYFYIIAQKNSQFIRSFSEVLQKPFLFLTSNSATITSWLTSYLGIPLVILFVLGTAYFIYKGEKRVLILLLYILFPFSAEIIFNDVLYPRFVLFYFPYIIIILSLALVHLFTIKNKFQRFIKYGLILIFAFPIFNSILLLTNPVKATIANSDAGQYLNDWPAGFGVPETVELIKKAQLNGPVYVGTEGTFGLLPYALNVYFFGQQNVQILGFWPVDSQNLPQPVLDAANNVKTYFVFNENQKEINNERLKLVAKFQKGSGKSFMRVYEVEPRKDYGKN